MASTSMSNAKPPAQFATFSAPTTSKAAQFMLSNFSQTAPSGSQVSIGPQGHMLNSFVVDGSEQNIAVPTPQGLTNDSANIAANIASIDLQQSGSTSQQSNVNFQNFRPLQFAVNAFVQKNLHSQTPVNINNTPCFYPFRAITINGVSTTLANIVDNITAYSGAFAPAQTYNFNKIYTIAYGYTNQTQVGSIIPPMSTAGHATPTPL